MNNESKSIYSAIIASIVTTVVVVTLIVSIAFFHKDRIISWLEKIPSSSSSATAVTSSDGSIVSAVKVANPAVVSIIISKNEPIYSNPFQYFFNQNRQNNSGQTQLQEVGGGSGFFVSSDGLIATNAHVVDDPQAEYTVYTNDGAKHTAKVISLDSNEDIAVIKIDGSNYPYLTFGNSDTVQTGQTAIAIGNALGEYQNTVSVGVVSGLSRSITAGDYTGNTEELNQLIQTDAAINPGNSGGPLLNTNAQVIGMNVALAESSQNIGFALPANIVQAAVQSVESKGYISHPYIGIRYEAVTDQIKSQYNLTVNYGMLVTSGGDPTQPAVIAGSPAAKAGIVEGDVIIEADGVKLTDEQTLSNLILKKKPGDSVTLKLIHKGQEKTVTLQLAEYNTQK